MGSMRDVHQVRQPGKGGDQKLKQFGLWGMGVGLLVQWQFGEGLGQSQVLGELTPQDQQGVLGQGARKGRNGRYAHGSSSSAVRNSMYSISIPAARLLSW
jgi:hypothetical protein